MGSSIGWLVFYGALALGVHAVGYELLPSLVAVAEQTNAALRGDGGRRSGGREASPHGGGGGGGGGGKATRAGFVCGDMLAAPLRGARVVLLASQCWDAALYHATAAKMARELVRGAVVVDYGDKLGGAEFGGAFGAEPAATVRAPVSWNRNQSFYVWVKV